MPEEFNSFDSKQKRRLWENHIKQWETSGQSRRAYCKKHGLIVNRFYDWKRRITAADKPHVSYLPVVLTDSPENKHLSVRINTPNEFTIEVEDKDGSMEISQLVSMVAAL
jgi:hypothetical protein